MTAPTETPAAARSPAGGIDEAFDELGRPRPLYERLLETLAGVDLEALRAAVADHLEAAGVTFGADGAPFRVDPVPRLLAAEEWERLARGLEQRARALSAFVADAHGSRRIVAAGVIPARVIDSCRCYEPWLTGVVVPDRGWVAGMDVVRCDDGELRVLEDNTRTPSGLAYLAAARAALAEHLPGGVPEAVAHPADGYRLLRRVVRGENAVLLSDGPTNVAFYEHREYARALDLPIVTPADLAVRRGRLVARSRAGRPTPVDVVYRRTDVDSLRDRAGRPTWLAELLLEPVRRGHLAVVNPLGSGVADDKLVHAYAEEMVRFYLGEEPLVESVPTYDLGEPDAAADALERLDELVIKPRDGLGGDGVVVCRAAPRDVLETIRRKLREQPTGWVAQETIPLSTHPTVIGGRLQPRHVDLRPYVVAGTAVEGGLTRVALDEGSLVVNSSQNGGGKDTWVMP